jgi:hypothetical protein
MLLHAFHLCMYLYLYSCSLDIYLLLLASLLSSLLPIQLESRPPLDLLLFVLMFP